MKILFTADWHIKLNKKNIPNDWAINRYNLLFSSIIDLCDKEKIDLLIIGGDIFDKLPTMDELTLFLDFIPNINCRTLIYDGNHEATKRGKTFLTLLKDMINRLNNHVTIIDGITTLMFAIDNIDIIPYTHIKTFNPKDFTNDILCTHVRGEIKPHVKPEIDLSKLDGWKTVLAGDLHAYSNSQRNILYPGSPVTTSFHRSNTQNGVIIFDTETHEHEFIDLKLPQLIRKTVESEEEMVKTDYDLTIYELVGNTSDISNVDNELLDKKIVNKNTEATLDLKDKSIEEEIIIYLRDVMLLKEEQIEACLGVHCDYT